MTTLETTLFLCTYFGIILISAWVVVPWYTGTDGMFKLLKWRLTRKKSKVELLESILAKEETLRNLTRREASLNKEKSELEQKISDIDARDKLFGTIYSN